ncbi:Hypothetical protein D9617_7g032200 [Elsinoe fawcettii]|nr:Hypothetical protein D9617_7g032200 [Elsinoe fawcettii]
MSAKVHAERNHAHDDPLVYRILTTIYSISPSAPPDNDFQDLKVIALGLSRTGTESLSKALTLLGYAPSAHGIDVAGDPGLSAAWIRLAFRKHSIRITKHISEASSYRFDSGLRADTFDKILGPYVALTDNPGTLFAEELIAAYPDAKIIVNKRSDINAWHESWMRALLPFCFDKQLQALSFFDNDLFWMVAGWTFLTTKPYRVDNWKESGRSMYQQHYVWIEDALRRHGRSGSELQWEVQDGWAPLCHLLERSIPDVPFPNGNAPGDFHRLINKNMAAARWRAERNVAICLGLIAAIVATCLWYRQA